MGAKTITADIPDVTISAISTENDIALGACFILLIILLALLFFTLKSPPSSSSSLKLKIGPNNQIKYSTLRYRRDGRKKNVAI